MLADLLAPWLLTYLLHSTLLLGTAWLATRLWRAMPVALQESLWRTALLGGVLTASAQVAIGWEPWSGHLAVAPLEAHIVKPAPAPPLPTLRVPDATQTALLPTLDAAYAIRSPHATVSEPATTPATDPGVWFAALWLGVVACVLLRSRHARRDLRARLASRVPARSADLLARLEALRAMAGVRRPIRLTQSGRFSSPIALGILDAEIVVPDRASAELSAGQLEVMLAHELAHHVRRDPLWLALTRCLTSALFFQPLNRLAGKRLRETSELLCDAWAAQRTGRGRELAECLTTVAGWIAGERTLRAVPAMAAEGSMLERRVERLIAGATQRPSTTRAPTRMLTVLPLVAVALLAPAVATGASTTAAPAGTPPPIAPVTDGVDVHAALALLDEEITLLSSECATLLDLLGQVTNAPEALRRGAARLEARLTALKERRAALVRDAKELK